MAINRTTRGLIEGFDADDGSRAFSTSGWNAPTGISTIELSGGRLRIRKASGTMYRIIERTSATARGTAMTFTSMTVAAGGHTGVAGHVTDSTADSEDNVGVITGFTTGLRYSQTEYAEDAVRAALHQQTDLTNKVPGTFYRLTLSVDGLAVKARDHFNSITLGPNDGPVSSGKPGVIYYSGAGSLSALDVLLWFDMPIENITVTGVPSGGSVEVRDSSDNVLSSGAESGGSATVSLFGLSWGIVHAAIAPKKVVVKNSGGTVTETWDAAGEAGTEYVYGGDVYEVGAAPAEPTADVIEVSLFEDLYPLIEATTPGTGSTSRTVHRSTTSSFTADASNLIDTLDEGVTAYLDESVLPGDTYYYQFLAINDAGSTVSNEVSIAVPAASGTAPAKPTLSLVSEEDTLASFLDGGYSHPEGVEGLRVELYIEERDGTPVLGPILFPIIAETEEWKNLTVTDIPTGEPELQAYIIHRSRELVASPASDLVLFELFPGGSDTPPEPIDEGVGAPVATSGLREYWPRGLLMRRRYTLPSSSALNEPPPGPACSDPFDYEQYAIYVPDAGRPPYQLVSAVSYDAVVRDWATDFLHGGRTHGIAVTGAFRCASVDEISGVVSFVSTAIRYGTPATVPTRPYQFIPFNGGAPYTDDLTPESNVITSDSFAAEWQDPPSMIGSVTAYDEIIAFWTVGTEPASLITHYDGGGSAGIFSIAEDLEWIIEVTQDGTTWTELQRVAFGRRYFSILSNTLTIYRREYESQAETEPSSGVPIEGSAGWSASIDVSGLEDGFAQLRIGLDSEGALKKVSRPFFIDREDAVYSYHGGDGSLNTGIFEFSGSDGESGRAENVTDVGVRRNGLEGTSGFWAIPEVGPLTDFEIIVTGAWATVKDVAGKIGGGLLFINEPGLQWGAGGYYTEVGSERTAIVAMASGATTPFPYNRPNQEGHGASYFSLWDSGATFGRGTGRYGVGHKPPGSTGLAVATQATESDTQWSQAAGLRPRYTLRLQVQRIATNLDGSHQVRARMSVWGPDQDTDAGWVVTENINTFTWPDDGLVGLWVHNDDRAGAAEFYSIAVMGIVAPVTEFPGRPCSLEYTLFYADSVTIRAQMVTDFTWLGESGEAKPYLLDPVQHGAPYGEQEVDFAEGTASIGQVNIRAIDPPTVARDQDSGWLTALLPHIAGHRNRLRRFISEDEGWVTIADGPGGHPQLGSSFAGYGWEIKDTREKERKLRAFLDSGSVSVYPPGLYNENWGNRGDDTYLLEAVSPQSGTFAGNVDTSAGEFFFSGTIPYTLPMKEAAQIVYTNDEETEGYFPNVLILWRYAGDDDTQWREIRNMTWSFARQAEPWLFLTAASFASVLGDNITVIKLNFDASEPPEEPTDNSDLEVFVLYAGPSSSSFPFYLDDLTAGQLLKNLYDGIYSPKDPITGEPVPTGIRYDEAALLAMTTPVRLRITEPVKDIRSWAEENIYAPLGYAPALDADGRISPVSQVIPTDEGVLAALTVIDNDITQAVPGHAPGENVINVLNFKYQRAYSDPTNSTDIDGLVMRDIEYEYRDETSAQRHGEQELEIESVAFVAVGDDEADAIGTETGALLWASRRDNMVINRRVNGTDLAVVPCMRLATFHLRVGDWVRITLTWIPNQFTGRRTLNHLAQILAVKDLNCSWREFTFELVQPWTLPDTGYDYEVVIS